MVSGLLSASLKRIGVSRMHDFYNICWNTFLPKLSNFLLYLNCVPISITRNFFFVLFLTLLYLQAHNCSCLAAA